MRLELSRRTDLAMRTLAVLNDVDSATGHEIAESIETTINYLPQVLKPLVQDGIIESHPGPGGGYRLNAELAELNVRQILEAVEGEFDDHHCVLRGAACHGPDHCVMHSAWITARTAFLEELERNTVEAAMPGFIAHADGGNAH